MSAVITRVALIHDVNGVLTNDGLRGFTHDATGGLASVATGASEASPTTR